MYTEGTIDVRLKYLRDVPPFNGDGARDELLNHLKPIPGTWVDDSGRIAARPRTYLKTLTVGSALHAFLSVLHWIVNKLRGGDAQ